MKRSLASLLPPAAEGGCARRHTISARPLWYRSLRSTYPTGAGGSPTAPTTRSWNAAARGLHWLMAVLIVLQGLMGWIAQEMERSPARVDAMTFHKSLGITLLLLLLLRLAWRWTHPAPSPPGGSSAWEIRLAQLTHLALYLLLGGISLSGWVAASAYVIPWKLWWLLRMPRIVAPDKATYDLASGVHETLVAVFLAVLAVHVAAALWHHFVKRDGVLTGMWRGER